MNIQSFTASRSTLLAIMYTCVFLYILLVAIHMRFTGHFTHIDNEYVLEAVETMHVSDSWNPKKYNHPNHLGIYIHSTVYSLVSQSVYKLPLVETFQEHRSYFEYIGSNISKIFGAFTVLLAFLIGREFHKNIALYAMFLFATFIPFYVYSHYLRPDSLFNFTILTTVLFFMKYVKRQKAYFLLLSAFTAAAATSVKYPGVILPIFFCLFLCWMHRKDFRYVLKIIGLYSIVYIVGFVCLAPYVFLDISEVISVLRWEATRDSVHMDQLGFFGNVLYYPSQYLLYTNTFVASMSIYGMYVVLQKRMFYGISLFSGLALWIFLSIFSLHWIRWGFPLYMSLLIFAAIGIHYFIEYVFVRYVKNSKLYKQYL